jgi:hypothetical protein
MMSIGAVIKIPRWEIPSSILEANITGNAGINACTKEITAPNKRLSSNILLCPIFEV